MFVTACLLALSAQATSITIEEGDTQTEQIRSANVDDVVINRGTITGITDASIYSTATGVTITNEETGRISAGATGIYSMGAAGAIITNSGSIATSGDDSSGVFSTGDKAEITNSGIGTITTEGVHSEGIYSDALNAMITNSGIIT